MRRFRVEREGLQSGCLLTTVIDEEGSKASEQWFFTGMITTRHMAWNKATQWAIDKAQELGGVLIHQE